MCSHRFCWKCFVLGPIQKGENNYRLTKCPVCRELAVASTTTSFQEQILSKFDHLEALESSSYSQSSVGGAGQQRRSPVQVSPVQRGDEHHSLLQEQDDEQKSASMAISSKKRELQKPRKTDMKDDVSSDEEEGDDHEGPRSDLLDLLQHRDNVVAAPGGGGDGSSSPPRAGEHVRREETGLPSDFFATDVQQSGRTNEQKGPKYKINWDASFCVVCTEPLMDQEIMVTPCDHVFHRVCLLRRWEILFLGFYSRREEKIMLGTNCWRIVVRVRGFLSMNEVSFSQFVGSSSSCDTPTQTSCDENDSGPVLWKNYRQMFGMDGDFNYQVGRRRGGPFGAASHHHSCLSVVLSDSVLRNCGRLRPFPFCGCSNFFCIHVPTNYNADQL